MYSLDKNQYEKESKTMAESLPRRRTSRRINVGRITFQTVNITLLLLLAAICLLPFINVIAVSLSNNAYIDAGMVTFWPMGTNIQSYEYLLNRSAFWNAFRMSVFRLLLGTSINLILLCLTAYPLSKPNSKFHGRTVYAWFFFITMLINGGLIPNYMVISTLKLRNTIWALVLPTAVQVYDLILMLNFFRQVPTELEDAALIDGASHFRTMLRIYVPVSMPAIATMTLFCMVNVNLRPLQTFLRQTLIGQDYTFADGDEIAAFADINDRSLRCAQIIIATIPILCSYPFLQRYFVKGIIVGSVKG